MVKFGIEIGVEDEKLDQLLKKLGTLNSTFGGATAKAVKEAAVAFAESETSIVKAVEQSTAKISGARKVAAEKAKEIKLSEVEVEERANKAVAESAQKYAKLKAEYEGRSLDDVREKIHALEQDTRTLRKARSDEDDSQVRKTIQGRTNSVFTELQLYRSLEKEKTGRTFSEQMERLNLESKTNKEIRTLLKQQASDFERLQHEMTVSQDTEEKKRLKQTIEELKAEQSAAQHQAEQRGIHTLGSVSLKGGIKEGLSGQLQNLASNAAASAGPLGGVVQQLSGVGPAGLMAAGGVGAAAFALKKSIDIGADFEDSVQELSAITGAEGKDLEGLSDKARELGKEFGGGAASGVEAFKLVVSALGPEVAKDQAAMSEMGNDVMTLAKAAGVDAPNATSVLTNTLNQFGGATLSAKDQAKEMTRIMNVMAAGAKEGAAEIPDLSEAIKIVGTVAHGSKMSVEETTAAIETMSMSGLKGGEAGTGLRNVILDLSSGTKRATGALSELGLTFDDVNPEKVGFTKSLQIMKEHLGKVTDATQRAEIMSHLFGKENIASANILIGGVDQVKQMTGAVTGTNEAHEQAEKRMNTFHNALAKLSATFQDAGISIFGTFGPALTAMLKFIQPIIVPLGVIVGAIGTIILVSKAWTIAQTALNIVMSANPIGLVVLALAGLAAGLIYLYKNVKPVHDIMDRVWDILKKVGQVVWEGIKFWAEWLNPVGLAIKVFKNFDVIISTVWGTFKKLGSFIADFVSKEVTNLAKAFGGVGDVISGVTHMDLSQIKKGIGEVASSIGGIIGLADGAVLTSPTIIGMSNGTPIVGGEAGAEAVIPLDKYPGLKRLMEGATDSVAQSASLSASNNAASGEGVDTSTLSSQEAQVTSIAQAGADARISVVEDEGESKNKSEKKSLKERLNANKEYVTEIRSLLEISSSDAIAAENDRYNAILRRGVMSGGDLEKVEKEHQSKLQAAEKQASDKRMQIVSDFAEKKLGIQGVALLKEQGGFKKFALQNLATLASNYAAQILTTTVGENTKTAATLAGAIARVAIYVWEGIQSIAATAATWIATAAKAVYSAFASAPFPVNLALAGAALASVYELSVQVPKLFKHKEGGMLLSERMAVTPGGNLIQRGEAGPEVDIPLHKVPQFVQDVTGNHFKDALTPVLGALREIHGATVANGGDLVFDTYGNVVGGRQTQRIVNTRRVR